MAKTTIYDLARAVAKYDLSVSEENLDDLSDELCTLVNEAREYCREKGLLPQEGE